MICYLHGSPDKPPVAEHTLICSPAGHRPREFPIGNGDDDDWWDHSGDKPHPRQFEVKFFHGTAEVPDPLGRYLIATGLAEKSRLILPNAWDR
jgi:hypothetical protein